jgi:hypothetical protein
MNENGYCTVCDGNCPWNDHVNNDFEYEQITEIKIKTD